MSRLLLTLVSILVGLLAGCESGDSGEAPSDAPPPSLAEERVIARGEVNGQPWRLEAQPFENGMCVELSGNRGCASNPTDDSPLMVFEVSDSTQHSGFVFGVVVNKATEVGIELANEDELTVEATAPALGFRFYVVPVPAGPDPVAVTARDEDGVELTRVELAPTR